MYIDKLASTFLSIGIALAGGCADDQLASEKTKGQNTGFQNGNQNPGQRYTNQPTNQSQYGTGQNQVASESSEDDIDYPAFLLRGKGTMQHKSGQVNLERKITYKIDDLFQETTLDVMVAVSGDYAKQVNESMINNGVSSNLVIKSTRSNSDDLSQAESAVNGYKAFKAYIYANKIEKKNTYKNETFTWNASRPIPIGVRPGANNTYQSLKENGRQTYETQITGEKSFTLKTTIEVVSLTDSQAVLKMTNTALNDASGQLMNNFPLPEEQTVTVDTSKKEIRRYETRSFYIEQSNSEKYYMNLAYEICAFKKGGELTVYTMCNY